MQCRLPNPHFPGIKIADARGSLPFLPIGIFDRKVSYVGQNARAASVETLISFSFSTAPPRTGTACARGPSHQITVLVPFRMEVSCWVVFFLLCMPGSLFDSIRFERIGFRRSRQLSLWRRIDRHEVSTSEHLNPSPPAPKSLGSKARKDMVEAAGTLFQLLGLSRSAGQIYGLLYLSDKPLSLGDMVNLLSISKGSASMGTRHLANWGAIRQVWVPGDRRDHYEAVEDLGQLLRASYAEFVKPRLTSSEQRLTRLFDELERDVERGAVTTQEFKFCSDRLRVLLRFQEKVQSIGPLAEKLLL